MQEKMLREYLDYSGEGIYPDSKIEVIEERDGAMLFIERSSCGYYTEQHTVSALELIQWLYCKINKGE